MQSCVDPCQETSTDFDTTEYYQHKCRSAVRRIISLFATPYTYNNTVVKKITLYILTSYNTTFSRDAIHLRRGNCAFASACKHKFSVVDVRVVDVDVNAALQDVYIYKIVYFSNVLLQVAFLLKFVFCQYSYF